MIHFPFRLLPIIFCLWFLANVALSAQTPIACDGDVSGNLTTNTQVDQYAFNADAGDIIIIRMQADGSSVTPKIQLTGPGVNQTDIGSYSDAARIGAIQLPQSGAFLIKASDDGSNATGAYGLSLQVIKASCATPIGCTDDINSTLGKKAEMDAYTFDVTTAGEYVIARMQQDGSSINGHLELYKVGATAPAAMDAGSYSDPARIDATNLQPGTYVLLVMDEDGVYIGGYGLSLQFVKADCATPIGCTDDVNGNLGKKAEMDAYTFDVTSAGEYVIARMQQDGSSINGHLELFKVGATAPVTTDAGSYSDPARIDATNLQPGTYVLLVMDEDGVYIGGYGLSLQFVKADCATPIGCTDDVNGNLGKKAEMDAYTFDVTTAGEYVIARMQQDGSSINGHLELYKVGATAPVTTDAGSYSDPARIDATNLQPGTYILLVMDEDGVYTGNFGLSLQYIKASCATPIGCTDDVNGNLGKKAEIDAYTFDVSTAGEYVIARMQQDGSSINGHLELFKVGATAPVATDAGSYSDPARIDATNLQPGTYVLLVMDEDGVYIGGYGLSLQFVKADCATPIGCTDDVNGNLGKKAEMDAYTFDVTTAGEYVITRMQQDGSSINGHLELFKVGATAPVATDAGSYSDPARIDATNLQPGTYILLVMDEDGVYIGNYGLSLQFVKASCATPIGCTDDVNGNLGKKAEMDAYTFDVTTAGEYVIARMQQDGSSIYGHLELFKVGSTAPLFTDDGSYSDPARLEALNLEPGTYILLVMDKDGGYIGNYGLSVQFVKADCATPIGCSADVNGNLGKKAEIDAYTFDITVSGAYAIARMQQDGSSIYGRLELFRVGAQAPIYTATGSYSNPARIDGINLLPGTYVLLVMDEDGVYLGNYGLSVQQVTSTCSTALDCSGDIGAGLTKKAQIDAYAFAVSAGDYYTFQFHGKSSSPDYRLEFYDGNGAPIPALPIVQADIKRLDLSPVQLAGISEIIVLVMDEDGNATGDYDLSIQRLRPSCAQLLACGEDVQGNIAITTEMDAFAIPVQAGDHLIMHLLEKVSSAQLQLEFYHANGLPWLPTVTTTGSLQRFEWNFLQADTLLIIASETGMDNVVAEYGLSVQLLRAECAATLTCPDQVDLSGNLDKLARVDAYAFVATAGKRFIVKAKGVSANFNGVMDIYSPAGTLYTQVPATSGFNQVTPSDSSGRWYVLLRDEQGNAAGSYSISFLEVGIQSCATDMILCGGSTVTGNLFAKTSMHQYKISGQQGQKLILRARGVTNGLIPKMELYRANGIQIGSPQQARLEFTFDASSDFFLVVSENASSVAGSFQLASHVANDFSCGQAISYNQTDLNQLSQFIQMNGHVFTGKAGDMLAARFGSCSATFDAQIELYNAAGLLLKSAFMDNGIARMDTFRLPADGQYKFLVMEREGDETGDYGFALQKVNPGFNAPILIPGTATNGNFGKAAEMHVYTFTTTAGMPATLTMNTLNGTLQPRLELYDPFGKRLAGPTGGATTATLSLASLPANGTYTVLAFAANTCGAGDYTLKLQATLTAAPAALSFSGSSGTKTFALGGNCPDWEITDYPIWLTVTPQKGNSPTTITVQCDPNPLASSRTGTITIQGCGITISVSVTQAGATLIANPTTINVGALAGQASFFVAGTCGNWTISPSLPWLSVSPISGSGPDSVRVSFKENTSATPRTTTITLSGCGITVTIVVIQAGAQPKLSANPQFINVGGGAGNIGFAIASNCGDWELSTNANWLSLSQTTGSDSANITVAFVANPGASPRVATVLLTGCGITIEITITQAGAMLDVHPPAIWLESPAGDTSFTVSGTCTNWTISGMPSWLIVDPASGGPLPAEIKIEYQANTTGSVRTATLQIFGCGIVRTITISQGVVGTHTPGPIEQLAFFPNPAADGIYVQIPASTGGRASLALSDMNGRVHLMMPVGTADQIWLERGSLPAGIYLLQLRLPDGRLLANGRVVFVE